MPNPKVGTVSTDVTTAVKNAKAGQVRYRTDKAGIIHSTIGKADFETDALKGNLHCPDHRPDQAETRGFQGRIRPER